MSPKLRRDRAGPGRSSSLLVRVADGVRRGRTRFALVAGCPRSGTTAVVEWLAAQPDVAGFNESRILLAAHRFLEDVGRFTVLNRRRGHLARVLRAAVLEYYRSVARRPGSLIVDKEPLEPIALPGADYDRFLQHVRLLFPGFRLLYLVRHPVPTIWSMLNRRWGYTLTTVEPREFSLEECLDTWKANAALAASLRQDPAVRVFRFEDLVGGPEAESRNVLEFLKVRGRSFFEPRPTAEVGFEPEVRDQILAATAAERRLFDY